MMHTPPDRWQYEPFPPPHTGHSVFMCVLAATVLLFGAIALLIIAHDLWIVAKEHDKCASMNMVYDQGTCVDHYGVPHSIYTPRKAPLQ